jgi:heptosyltransferase-2
LKTETIKRVVVRGANWVGDSAITIPALRELRSLLPRAHITLATRPGPAGLFTDADFIDDLIISESSGWGSLRRQIVSLRRGNFDLAVIFPNSFQTALVAALARVPFRLGYAAQGRGFLLTHSQPQPEWRDSRHEVYYYVNIIAAVGCLLHGNSRALDHEPDYAIVVSPERRAAAREQLASLGVRSDRALVAICPGSVNSRAKRWPADRYAELGSRMAEELGSEVMLIGSPDERDVSFEVARQMQTKPIIATGSTDLAQTTAILSCVDLLITNDTGPAHIASALRRPTLVIFGPTNPLTTRPFSSTGELIRQPPVCAPCMLRDCPIDHRCMTAISPDEVFQRASRMLQRSYRVDQLLGVR